MAAAATSTADEVRTASGRLVRRPVPLDERDEDYYETYERMREAAITLLCDLHEGWRADPDDAVAHKPPMPLTMKTRATTNLSMSPI